MPPPNQEKSSTALVITPEPAWPVVDGWGGRHNQLIRSLAEFSAVDVVTLAPPSLRIDQNAAQRQLQAMSFTVIRHAHPSKRIAALKSLITSEPLGSILFHSETLRGTLGDLCARNQYDYCLILGDICMAQYAANVQARVTVLDMCDDVAFNYDRRAQCSDNGVIRAYYRRQANVIRTYLRAQCSVLSRIITISEPDEASLSRDVEVPVVTVPNGVDAEIFRPSPVRVSSPHDPQLLFVGAMRSWSNRDAVEWFASSVMPAIVRENPGARLHLVGSGTDRLAIANPSVIARGFAQDLAAEYRSCDVFVCPLRVGTGIKNKLMEALASGCAIVSTTVGTDGLAVRHGEHLLVADDPLDFALAVNRLLREPELRTSLGRAARTFTEKSLSTEKVSSCLRAAMLLDENAHACFTNL